MVNRDLFISALKEREKELKCLYTVEHILSEKKLSLDEISMRLVNSIPAGWQYPNITRVRIELFGKKYIPDDFLESEWKLSETIVVNNQLAGEIVVYYVQKMPEADVGPFLNEEKTLLATIASRIGNYVYIRELEKNYREMEINEARMKITKSPHWRKVFELLKTTDQRMYFRMIRKMLNLLLYYGIKESEVLFKEFANSGWGKIDFDSINEPGVKSKLEEFEELGLKVFKIAENNIDDDDIFSNLKIWIEEDKSLKLLKIIESQGSSFSKIADALCRFEQQYGKLDKLPQFIADGTKAALIRRVLSDDLTYINITKKYVELDDFIDLFQRTIYLPHSKGKLGGKRAGLFLAEKILRQDAQLSRAIKFTKMWNIVSDVMMDFIYYNNLEEVIEQKYKTIGQIRLEYPHICQLFKNAYFPPELNKDFKRMLEDLEGTPIVVRSSSLLEDRIGSVFSGKYKSLFLPNTGSMEERLERLTDAIAEIYASIFSPDAIEYRMKNNYLDFNEEMAIIVQPVVGNRVGEYYFPAYSGVLFGKNNFPWNENVTRDGGMIRIIPGLGTLAVDRMEDNFPVLISPEKPTVRVNSTLSEQVKYAPTYMDVINLKNLKFETVKIKEIINKSTFNFPMLNHVVSKVDNGVLSLPIGRRIDFTRDQLVVTFDGLICNTRFISHMTALKNVLNQATGMDVDVEFSSDGQDIYLLQFRAQSNPRQEISPVIPSVANEDNTMFKAFKYVTNGVVSNIEYIVFIDPHAYWEETDEEKLNQLPGLIAELNKLLPNRNFILMGPGRWGCRGELRYGIKVSYADISNTCMLIEMGQMSGDPHVEPSFGTHFFQDLIEADIKYLAINVDMEKSLNMDLINSSTNSLMEILPEYEKFQDLVKIIHVPFCYDGRNLQVVMNADVQLAVGYLHKNKNSEFFYSGSVNLEQAPSSSWRWRFEIANEIAAEIIRDFSFVKKVFLIGSVKNRTAGPASDVDLVIHVRKEQASHLGLRERLLGWGHAIANLNFMLTGYKTDNLLDYHFITDEDILRGDSFAVKIEDAFDKALELPMKEKE